MEDSFRARVDKAFGSLASSSSAFSALWSLTDEEIERRERNRERDSDDASPDRRDQSCASNRDQTQTPKLADFGEQLRSDLQEPDDDDDDDNPEDPDDYSGACNDHIKRKKPNPRAADDQDFDIRSSIGLDCTLDYEEEEDEYDMVAVGREKASDRLYMRDIIDYGIDTNSHHELPSSFKNVPRDPRANHMAAKLRLKEDAETAGNFDSLKLSEASVPPVENEQVNQLGNGVAPKPILKKREILPDGKSPKRVRFQGEFLETKDPAEPSSPIEGSTSQGEADNLPQDQLLVGEAKATEEVFSLPHNSTSANEDASLEKGSSYSVPDYLRNPSRYTCYTLDSSDNMDEESNRKACMDFLNLLKKSNAAEPLESSACSPKSLTFTPKKKANDTSLVWKDSEHTQNQTGISKDRALPVGIAAGDAEDGGSEVCPMEEDKPDHVVDKSCSSQKPGRRYRSRTNVD